MANRFQGFPCPEGILVLDSWTGEVVRLAADGSPPIIIRSAVARMPTAVGVPAPPDTPERIVADRPAAEHDTPWGDPVKTGAAVIDDVLPAVSTVPTTIVPLEPLAQSQAPDAVVDDLVLDPPVRPIPARATAFDQEVLATYPYPIARTWLAFLEEDDPRQRCKLLVDTFTNVLKLWALQVASEYVEAAGVKDANVNRTLARDFQRPLISAWNLMLARALPVLRSAEVPLFAPELLQAYEELETKCLDKVEVSSRYEDAEGNFRTKTSKLGKITALIRYRNGLAHGYNQSRQKARDDLERQLPILKDVLKAARFTARYPLYGISERRGDGALIAHRLMGAWPSADEQTFPRLDVDPQSSPLFLFDEAERRALPMLFFLQLDSLEGMSEAVVGTGRDVLLFEGSTRNTVIYVAPSGEHVEKQSRIRQWKRVLARKELDVRSMTADRLTIDDLSSAAERQRTPVLEKLAESGKYLPDVSADRAGVAERLSQFEHGDYRGIIFGGESGIGKTTLLARYAEQRAEAGDIVLFYGASTLVDVELGIRIVRDLGVRGVHLEDLLASADPLLRDGKRVLVVVDAINEHPSDAAGLVRAIDGVVRQAESYPWFRLVGSIRTAAYERLPPDARFGRVAGARYVLVDRTTGESEQKSPIVDVPPLSDEELASLYERYRAYRRPDPDDSDSEGAYVFRPRTAFDELEASASTRRLMRNPLMLRLLLSAFHRRPLPSEVSFDDAMGLYVDHVVVEKSNPAGAYPERRVVLTQLVRILDGEGVEAIERDRLYDVARLKAALQNPQRDSPYVQLLDLGVLVEEWDDERCFVRFAFAGLFEYLLAERCDPRIEGASDLLEHLDRAIAFRPLRGALGVVVRRAIEQGRSALVLEALDRCGEDGADERAALYTAVLRDVIVDLGRFEPETFDRVLAALSEVPSESDVKMLVDAFDRLYAFGEVAIAKRAADVAVAEAEQLGVASLRASAMLRRAYVEQLRGHVEQALATMEEARQLAEEADAKRAMHRIDVLWGQVLLSQDRLEDADAAFERAFAGLVELGDQVGAATVRRGQASAAGRRGDLARRRLLNEEALAISQEAGDRTGLARAFNNLAIVHTQLKDPRSAEACFSRALSIQEELGERRDLATTLMNFGTLYLSCDGDVPRAREAFERAFVLFEELEAIEGVSLAATNLGVVCALDGRQQESKALLERARGLFEDRGDTWHTAYVLFLQISFALDAGDTAEAYRWASDLRDLADELDRPRVRLHEAAIRVRLAVLDGRVDDVDSALENLLTISAELKADAWDVEDGPAGAYLDAASFLADKGEIPRAADLIERTVSMTDGRVFHRRDKLEELAQKVAEKRRDWPQA